MKRVSVLLTVALVATLLGTAPAILAKEKKQAIERFSATAYNWLGNGKVAVMEIQVYEWSSSEEREALIGAFHESGSDGLVSALAEAGEKGFVRTPNSVGYKMNYAFEFDQGETRMIVMATNRPISPRATTDSAEHNVTLVMIEIDKATDKGTGQMIVGAEIGFDDESGRIQIKSAAREPIRFTSVKVRKTKN